MIIQSYSLVFLNIILILFYVENISAKNEEKLHEHIKLAPINNIPITILAPINNSNSDSNVDLPVLLPGKCWTKQLSISPPPPDAFILKNQIYIKECCKGYKISLEQPTECIPICEQDCLNGICTSPNFCTCSTNAVKSLSNNCVQTCPVGCLNGECFNSQCLCNSGYELDDETQKFCRPICSKVNIPENGNCTEPYKYDCKKGFRWNIEHTACEVSKCVPFCRPGSRCNEKNQCECDTSGGFVLLNGTCQNTCSKGCTNGQCVDKDKCECTSGWKLNIAQNGCEKIATELPNCTPICGPSSRCIATNQCECDISRGFKLINGTCQNTCSNGCTNGRCIDKDICICDSGWKLNTKQSGCEKITCSNSCAHGNCSPITGKCECNTGYKLNNAEICVPQCGSGCPSHSDCVSRNKCKCHRGYYNKFGRCQRIELIDELVHVPFNNKDDKVIIALLNQPNKNNDNEPIQPVSIPISLTYNNQQPLESKIYSSSLDHIYNNHTTSKAPIQQRRKNTTTPIPTTKTHSRIPILLADNNQQSFESRMNSTALEHIMHTTTQAPIKRRRLRKKTTTQTPTTEAARIDRVTTKRVTTRRRLPTKRVRALLNKIRRH